MRVSREEIEANSTSAGGFTREQLAKWGVSWPPPKGWKDELIAGEVPHPYKCSACDYVAVDRKDSKRHWMTEHQK